MAEFHPVEYISIYTDADAPRGRFYLLKTVPTYDELWTNVTEIKSMTTAPTDTQVPTVEDPDFGTETFPASISLKFKFPVESSVVTYLGTEDGYTERTFSCWCDPEFLSKLDVKMASL